MGAQDLLKKRPLEQFNRAWGVLKRHYVLFPVLILRDSGILFG